MADPAPSRFRLKRWIAEFADPATERAYRVSAFRDVRALNRLAFSVCAGAILAHCATDYWHFGLGPNFFYLLALRLAVIGLLLLIYPLTALPPQIARADAGTLGLQLLIPTVYFTVLLIMPAANVAERITIPSVSALLVLIGQYLFIANRLHYVAIAGIATSLGYFAFSAVIGRLSAPALVLETGVHLLCNLLGIVAVYRTGLLRRRQYALLTRQERLNRKLDAQSRRLEASAEDLRRARDDALHANSAKSEFLAYMSHELRSPMNAILGFSEIMKREMFGRMSSPKYREYAADIHGSATHLLSLINDILDLSKAEAGKLVIAETAVDLAAAAEAARRLVAVRAEDSHIALRLQAEANLPPLTADPRMVKQMILNLLSNAIKFTSAGGSVTIRVGRDDAGALFIAVADTGHGIDAAEIPRILEPYGRSMAADRNAAEGTGLGLPLVKAMIEAHDGALEIESKVGDGSTFTLRFPVARVGLAAAA